MPSLEHRSNQTHPTRPFLKSTEGLNFGRSLTVSKRSQGELAKPPPHPMADPAPPIKKEEPAEQVSLTREPSSASTVITEVKRKKEAQVRHFIAQELLQTEVNYVKGLETIIQHFIRPLKEAIRVNRPIVPLVEVKHIFSYIEDLLAFNRKVMHALEATMKNWSPQETSIGGVFTSFSIDEWNVYLKFINNYAAAKAAIRRAEENYPAYRNFIAECLGKKECQRQGINDHLILPVQRVTRYVLLLQDLKKHTLPDHPDVVHITQALDFMKTLASTVNEVKRREEEMTRMFAVQKTVEDCPATIISAHRRYLAEIEVHEVSRGRILRVYLFTDLVMIAKVSRERLGVKKLRFRFQRTLNLKDLIEASVEPEGGDLKNAFRIVAEYQVPTPAKETLVFEAPDTKRRLEFLIALDSAFVASGEGRRVNFGHLIGERAS